jgi:pilus assembly protein Flp/PilA
MKHVMKYIRRFIRDERGANGVEYALIAGLIAVAFVTGASLLGTNLNTFFSNTARCVGSPSQANCSIAAPASR